MIAVPIAKRNTAVFGMDSDILHFLVKILAQLVLVGFGLECHAIAQQIRNGLSGKVIVLIRCDFVVWRPNVRHFLAELIVNEFLKPHDRWVLVLVV